MDQQLVDLYEDCEAAVRLFNFMHRACSNLEERRPPELAAHIEAREVFTYRDMKATLMESLTKEDAYDLAKFVAVLVDRHPTLLYELAEPKQQSSGSRFESED
jgi:hypothetical protein